MEIEWHNHEIQKKMSNMEELRKIIGIELAKMVKLRFNQIEATENFQEFMKYGFGKPHPLKGNMKRYFGVGITGNYRLVVMPKGNQKIIVRGVIDYHGDKYNWLIP